jgi:predicted amidohydrolase YtcJ
MPKLLALLVFMTPLAARAQNEYVVHNARVHTVDAARPTAGAIAVRNGRIAGVGQDQEIRGRFDGVPHYDLHGLTLVPGFIDAHAHLMGLGMLRTQADLTGSTSAAEVIERLRGFERDLPEGAWLVGRGWDQNLWPGAAFPTTHALDAAFPQRPVWLRRVDGHAGWANSAALRAYGVERLQRVPDPEGGRILRDARGEPTGVFIDAAMALIDALVPVPDEAHLEEALRLALHETARLGLTGVHDAGVTLADLTRYRKAIDAGRFPLRLYAMIGGRGETFDHFCAQGPLLDYGGKLTVRSVKYYIDGALGSRGAALLEDYADDPENRGLLLATPEGFAGNVRKAVECGFQVGTHAIGDRGNRVVLDAYQQVISSRPDGRHRIEHAQVVSPRDLDRFGTLGVIASVQPVHAVSDMPWAETRLGAARLSGAYAWRSLIDAGARLAFGSDFPVEPPDPILGFHAAVARTDENGVPRGGWLPDQRVTREEALRGFTLGAAYAGFAEDRIGSIEVGKRADFVVLSQDIMTIPYDLIPATRVLATVLDGNVIHGALNR